MWDLDPELVWPLVGAFLAGALIGLEREARGRPAGLRTHTLVCLTSALLMVAAAHQARWTVGFLPGENVVADPTRMAHGILTGIGFLCGGVIFQHGVTVQGLTTAASLWATAAIGVLYGAGLYGVGALGTVAILVILVGMRWVDENLPRKAAVLLEVRYAREAAPSGEQFVAFMHGLDCRCSGVSHRLIEDGRLLQHSAKVRGTRQCLRALPTTLLADPAVKEFSVVPRDD